MGSLRRHEDHNPDRPLLSDGDTLSNLLSAVHIHSASRPGRNTVYQRDTSEDDPEGRSAELDLDVGGVQRGMTLRISTPRRCRVFEREREGVVLPSVSKTHFLELLPMRETP